MTNKTEILKFAQKELKHSLQSCETPTLKPNYRGKVRDVFNFNNQKELLIVATDRVSAFDCVLGTVPFKGAMLTKQAQAGLKRASEICDTHYLDLVDPQVMRVKKAEPFKFEMIIRGYLTGSLWREPAGIRGNKYGLKLDPDLKNNSKFDTPIITPSTKADAGEHDMPMSLQNILDQNLCTKKQLDEICETTKNLFAQGQAFAAQNNLILVDTKYEFGLVNNKVTLIDEIHTADSSRYWRENTCDNLDKENLRQALIQQGYDPNSEQKPPNLSTDLQLMLCEKYWALTETLLGENFVPPHKNATQRVAEVLSAVN